MTEPIIRLKKDNMAVEYYEDVPISEFLDGVNPHIYDSNNEEEIDYDISLSYAKRILNKNNIYHEFINFTEYPSLYKGIAYKRVDPKYPELSIMLYMYKSNNDYYIEYKYPISFEDNVLIASGFIDTAIKNYDIEIKDTKDIDDEESFDYGLALTFDDGHIRYDYSGGKLNKGLDFTLLSYVENLDEDTLDLFTIGEEGDKCLNYIVRTDAIDYIYLKNLETNIEYLYKEVEYEVNKRPFYKYLFLARCEEGTIYDEHNNVIRQDNITIYDLYIKKYIDRIEEFEKNYLKPCGMLKGFPEIDKELFSLDDEMSKRTNDISYSNKEITPSSIIKVLKKDN